jgi:hypothetical protein
MPVCPMTRYCVGLWKNSSSGINELLPPYPSTTTGSRGDLRHPRDGRAVRAAGDALLRRQGLHRHGLPGPARLLAGQDPLPPAAHRHRPQLPRNAGLPRLAGAAVGRATGGGLGAAVHRPRPRAGGAGAQPQPQHLANGDPAGRAGRAQVRGRHGRRPARRGEGQGQGALLLAPRPLRPVGSQEPAPGAVVAVQRPQAPGRGLPRLPAQQLDRDGRLAVHPAARHPHPRPLLLAPPRRAAARRHVAGRLRRGHTLAARAGGEPGGALPHHRRPDLHRRGGVGRQHAGRDYYGSGRGASPSAAAGPTTNAPRPPWKTARR